MMFEHVGCHSISGLLGLLEMLKLLGLLVLWRLFFISLTRVTSFANWHNTGTTDDGFWCQKHTLSPTLTLLQACVGILLIILICTIPTLHYYREVSEGLWGQSSSAKEHPPLQTNPGKVVFFIIIKHANIK